MYVCVPHVVCAGVLGGQKRGSDPLELSLQAVPSGPVSGTKSSSSARGASAPNRRIISPAPKVLTIN